jgi:hypothetical protein
MKMFRKVWHAFCYTSGNVLDESAIPSLPHVNMDTTASSEYLVPLYDNTRLHILAEDHTYIIQSSKIIESHVLEIILLLK